MGLETEDLRAVLGLLPRLERREDLLVLGDAQIHTDAAGLAALARETGFQAAEPPARLDALSLGSWLGFARTRTLDVASGTSITLNLHEPAPAELHGVFDCVLDAGVLFWCSDPGAALRTILAMTRTGGIVVHISALSGH